MKKSNEKMNVVSKMKKAAMNAVVQAAEPYEFGWPWCVGIIHQPKHPMIQKQQEK